VSDRKTMAIILGATIGVAAVATAVGIYLSRHSESEPVIQDVNDVFERARQTVKKLDEAVNALRKSAA
jgi:hypothetical protein